MKIAVEFKQSNWPTYDWHILNFAKYVAFQ